MDSNSSQKTEATPENALSECLLSQYQFCAGGTISGVLYGMKFPTGRLGRYTPFLVGGIAGSLADLMYGYNVACIREVAAEREYRHKGGTKREH